MTAKHKDNEGWEELAEKLGFTVRQVHRWRKQEGSPITADLEAWREFIDANGLGKDRGSPSLNKLKEEKLTEEIALLRHKRAQAEGATLSLDEMGDFVARFSAKLDQLLTLKLETEGPARIVGKEIVDVRKEMRALHDEIREVYNAGLLEWKPKA